MRKMLVDLRDKICRLEGDNHLLRVTVAQQRDMIEHSGRCWHFDTRSVVYMLFFVILASMAYRIWIV